MKLSAAEIQKAVRAALAEDIGSGDVTTLATVPANVKAGPSCARANRSFVAGIGFAEAAFRELSPKIKVRKLSRDGDNGLPPEEFCWKCPARRAPF